MFGDWMLYWRNRHRDICLPICRLCWEKPCGSHQDLLLISLILLYMEWYHQAAVWFAEAPKRSIWGWISWMIIFYFFLDAQSPWPWASTSAESLNKAEQSCSQPSITYQKTSHFPPFIMLILKKSFFPFCPESAGIILPWWEAHLFVYIQ